jgi:hypothetical protein
MPNLVAAVAGFAIAAKAYYLTPAEEIQCVGGMFFYLILAGLGIATLASACVALGWMSYAGVISRRPASLPSSPGVMVMVLWILSLLVAVGTAGLGFLTLLVP